MPPAFTSLPTAAVLESLGETQRRIAAAFSAASSGRLGYLDREWGFMSPGGLGPATSGPFASYSRVLDAVPRFFPPVEALEHFAERPLDRRLPPSLGPIADLHPQLPGHAALHAFLSNPPGDLDPIADREIVDYREAARVFIIMATLAHLAGNAADKPVPLPTWIEDPFRRLADRLEVPPALTGHFLMIENWTSGDRERDRLGPDIDRLRLLYSAFGHDQERVYHGIQACMAHKLRQVPAEIADLVDDLREAAEQALAGADPEPALVRATDRLHRIASALVRCKEEFQRISTDSGNSTYVSRYVFIRQMQPLHKGVLVRDAQGQPRPMNGVSGLHFSMFYMLDFLIGRYQRGAAGELARMRSVVDYFPPPQRAFAEALGHLSAEATLSKLAASIDGTHPFVRAFNRLIEVYAGDGGVLAAHARKILNYMHNGLQVDTAAEGHVGGAGEAPDTATNHRTACRMFDVMWEAIDERRRLRRAPTMTRVRKRVYSVSRSGSYGTVAFDLAGTGLRYERGDAVRALLPRNEPDADDWRDAFGADGPPVRLADLSLDDQQGWTWADLWEALGWDPAGVRRSSWYRWIESADIEPSGPGRTITVRNPRDLLPSHGRGPESRHLPPPKLPGSVAARTRPISPRIYSACGHEADRVFLMVSAPADHERHHGFRRMIDPGLDHAWIDFSPSTQFLVPPANSNLLMVATGTGITPFVGLASELPNGSGSITVVHQTRSSDLFLANLAAWLALTERCPHALVLGFVSGDGGGRNLPMRYRIRGGRVDDLSILHARDSKAYYFMSDEFDRRLRETTRADGRNLAYCCGGQRSAEAPVRDAVQRLGASYEFVLECNVSMSSFSRDPWHVAVGDDLIDVMPARSIHPGGADVIDRILHGLKSTADAAVGCPGGDEHLLDATRLFLKVHPNPYNLVRCLRTPADHDYEEFVSFIEREAARGRVLDEAAHHYTIGALDHPNRLDLVRAAAALELGALESHKKTDIGTRHPRSIERIVGDLAMLHESLPTDDPMREQVKTAIDEAAAQLSNPAIDGKATE